METTALQAAPRLGFRPWIKKVASGAPLTGKELDQETGLYYFGARYYDPRTSVWQSADPILEKYLPNFKDGKQVAGSSGGVFESSNLGFYTYGRNSPIVLKDPDGNIVPVLLAAWAVYEVASGAYDIYNAAKTVADPNATGAEKSLAVGGAVLSVVAPGGGYGTAGKVVAGAADKVGDAAKVADKVGDVASRLPIPTVSDPKLGNIVNDLYKGAKGPNPIGTGSTADAIRNERATGLRTHGTFHSDKGEQYINALNSWQKKNPDAPHHDRLVAESMKRDLQNALGKE